jgi:hypothetical protein
MAFMPTHTRTALLTHALIGYEERKAEITETIARIRARLGGKAPASTEPIHAPAPRRKSMSPSARRRMSLLMKQRWAKAKRGGKKSLKIRSDHGA